MRGKLVGLLFLLFSLPHTLSCGLQVTPTVNNATLGKTVRYRAIVTNNLQSDTFSISIGNEVRYWSEIRPESISLDTGEQGLFYLDVDAAVRDFPDIPVNLYNSSGHPPCNHTLVFLNVGRKEAVTLFNAPGLDLAALSLLLLLVVIYLKLTNFPLLRVG